MYLSIFIYYLQGNDLKVTVYSGGKHYQKIVGFGGAFTDATGINIGHHDQNLQQLIIEYAYCFFHHFVQYSFV